MLTLRFASPRASRSASAARPRLPPKRETAPPAALRGTKKMLATLNYGHYDDEVFRLSHLCSTLLTLLSAGSAFCAQCPPPPPILLPDASGQNGQTRVANFLTLVDALYQSPATQTLTVAGKVLQVPPWFDSSTECSLIHLQGGRGLMGAPSFTNYLVVSDEFSELAIVTALANRDDRMLAIHNTIQMLGSSKYPGIPCWLAMVSNGSLTCLSQDTASDATARIGLAYYFAANNPSFPTASRALYRAAGDALAAHHLQLEYANGCFSSAVTGRILCEWIAGGGDAAASGVGGLEMWIGYHQDIARFMIAAYMSTGNSVYLQRAEDVVDQYLMASNFTGGTLTVGRFSFGWATGSNPIQPIRPINDPHAQQFWDHDPAWDDADAPRALWMGDVLRALQLSTGAVPATAPYATLLDWVGKMQAADSQTPNFSCIQFNHDGTPVSGNCGHDYYYNGLGAGLHTYLDTAALQPKLDEALSQFGWNAELKTWNNASCFGIYRGIRPVKALASAIGLDGAAYACAATPPLCGSKPNELCLADGRFKITGTWQTAGGISGDAAPVSLTVNSGYFWFFDPSNIEIILKILDGCGLNGHFWVFGAGLTNVRVILTVTDTQTGATATYSNPQGVSFQPIQDTTALASCP